MNEGLEAEFILRLILTTHGAIVIPDSEIQAISRDIWNKRIAVTQDAGLGRYTIYLEETQNSE